MAREEMRLSQQNMQQLYDGLVSALKRIEMFHAVMGQHLPDREYLLLQASARNLAKFLDRVKM